MSTLTLIDLPIELIGTICSGNVNEENGVNELGLGLLEVLAEEGVRDPFERGIVTGGNLQNDIRVAPASTSAHGTHLPLTLWPPLSTLVKRLTVHSLNPHYPHNRLDKAACDKRLMQILGWALYALRGIEHLRIDVQTTQPSFVIHTFQHWFDHRLKGLTTLEMHSNHKYHIPKYLFNINAIGVARHGHGLAEKLTTLCYDFFEDSRAAALVFKDWQSYLVGGIEVGNDIDDEKDEENINPRSNTDGGYTFVSTTGDTELGVPSQSLAQLTFRTARDLDIEAFQFLLANCAALEYLEIRAVYGDAMKFIPPPRVLPSASASVSSTSSPSVAALAVPVPQSSKTNRGLRSLVMRDITHFSWTHEAITSLAPTLTDLELWFMPTSVTSTLPREPTGVAYCDAWYVIDHLPRPHPSPEHHDAHALARAQHHSEFETTDLPHLRVLRTNGICQSLVARLCSPLYFIGLKVLTIDLRSIGASLGMPRIRALGQAFFGDVVEALRRRGLEELEVYGRNTYSERVWSFGKHTVERYKEAVGCLRECLKVLGVSVGNGDEGFLVLLIKALCGLTVFRTLRVEVSMFGKGGVRPCSESFVKGMTKCLINVREDYDSESGYALEDFPLLVIGGLALEPYLVNPDVVGYRLTI
ncbi:hypothetical protein CVT24_004188 [Panaeolus cyanescens]|uniref:Uncharacterized protein n=1 Tax=Panaeolus cyanescens TaxID=181874 RepID=A0A409W7S2_9AGAR|nr:hypothetical protein CVT24_004188 [Panaeolus cyanescens]